MITDFFLRSKSKAVWADTERTVLTLESFSRTESDGGKDIGSAARKVTDPELKNHLERHAEDEMRHAEMFRSRAEQLRGSLQMPVVAPTDLDDRSYDLTRGRPEAEVDAHGFFTEGFFDEMGEVAYVAMLHNAELRAAKLFKMHKDLTKHDPETQQIFSDILRDEQYHVAWTRSMLDKWKGQGRAREVATAKSAARGGRLWGAWKRAGVRAGAGFSRVVLTVLYYTILLPFGFIASRSKTRDRWQTPLAAGDRKPIDLLRSQY